MAPYGTGATRFARRMTDAEALMWNVEKDPWLSSTIGTVLLTDRPVDHDAFRRKVAAAVAAIPRLRERVVPRLGRLAAPEWRADPDFELDHHVRHLALPPPGDRRQLLDLCCQLLTDPFDRTRPLWQFVVIDSVGEGGALLVKLHHTVTDGIGGVRLAERYMDLEAHPPAPPEVDLDALVAEAVAAEAGAGRAEEPGHGGLAPGAPGVVVATSAEVAGETAKRQLSFMRRLASETLLAVADPLRLPERGEQAMEAARTAMAQLQSTREGDRSPLWDRRSRRRRLEVLSLPFLPVKEAARALGGSVNDFFVAGAVSGAAAYHEAEDCTLERLTVTFIVSTREDATAGGNAFTPSKAQLPASPMAPAARFATVRDVLAARRSEVDTGDGLFASVAGVANVLPTTVVTRLARAQARGVDFATSNVKAAPFDVYVGGAKVTATFPVGPVAGTAFNVTLMSYSGQLHLGLHIDPLAVADPARLRSCFERAYADLIAAAGGEGGGQRRAGTRRRAGVGARNAPAADDGANAAVPSRRRSAKGTSTTTTGRETGRRTSAPTVSSPRRRSPSPA